MNINVEYTCPWFEVLAKQVELHPNGHTEIYYSVRTLPYHAILAVTEDGLIPLVRQFRPAVERMVVELPAGNRQPGETPEDAARRELREETGCVADSLVQLKELMIDSGRMTTIQHSFFAPRVRVVDATPRATEDLETIFVSPAKLQRMISDGDFVMASHVAVVCAAWSQGLLTF